MKRTECQECNGTGSVSLLYSEVNCEACNSDEWFDQVERDLSSILYAHHRDLRHLGGAAWSLAGVECRTWDLVRRSAYEISSVDARAIAKATIGDVVRNRGHWVAFGKVLDTSQLVCTCADVMEHG